MRPGQSGSYRALVNRSIDIKRMWSEFSTNSINQSPLSSLSMTAINRDSDEFATFHTPYCVDIFPQKNKAIKVVIVIGSRGSKLNVS